MSERPLDRDSIAKALRMLSAGDDSPADQNLASIGKFSIVRKLGFDGQATVLLAHDSQLIRDVVLKIYHNALDENQKTRIINEGRALAQINSPNVVRCYGVEKAESESQPNGSTLILVLEYIDGQSLADYLRNNRLSVHQKLDLFKQLVAGVKASHDNGVLHLDLKPSNVIVTDRGIVKLIDFGLVQSTHSASTTQINSGTPAFMSPEVALNTAPKEQASVTETIPINETTDVFGLGAILYFMFAGEAPFDSETKIESRKLAESCELDIQENLRAQAPAVIVNIAQKCLAKNQSQRYESADNILADIQQHFDRKRRKRILLTAAILVPIVTALMSIPYFSPRSVPVAEQLRRLRTTESEVLELVSQDEWSAAMKKQNECMRLAKHQDFRTSHLQEQTQKTKHLASIIQSPIEERQKFRSAVKKLNNVNLALQDQDWPALRNYVSDFHQNNTLETLLQSSHPNAANLNAISSHAANLLSKAELELADQGDPLPKTVITRLLDYGIQFEKVFGMQSNLSLQNKLFIARYFENIGLKNESVRTLGVVSRLTKTMQGYGQLVNSESQLELAMLTVRQKPIAAREFFGSYVQYEKSAHRPAGEAANPYLIKLCDFIIHFSADDTDMSIVLGQDLLKVVPTTLAEKKLRLLVNCRLFVATARKATASTTDENKQIWQEKAAQLKSQAVGEIDESFGYNKSIKIEAFQLLANGSAELAEWQQAFKFIDSAMETAEQVAANTSAEPEIQSATLTLAELQLEHLRICIKADDKQRTEDSAQQLHLLCKNLKNPATKTRLLETARTLTADD